ncbi:DUF1553 domain-containing protein, partial [Akkermansiaceae bacterium]|nr:DUF1553 domain-containing protein [Akkermansiaceae bacterium]
MLNDLSKGNRNEIARLVNESANRASLAKKTQDQKERKKWFDGLKRTNEALAKLISSDELTQWKIAEDRREKIAASGNLTMITKALQTPRISRILPRGNWLDESGEIVQPAVPHFLPKIKKEGRQTRLDLANWLTDPQHGTGGLTARVTSNRLFYLFFGSGLSRSLGDFGGQGQPPSHPKLLDRLAVELYESNWDI